MSLAISIIGLAAAIAASVAAIGSWRAAVRANQAAGVIAAIEQDRHRDELTPQFRIKCHQNGVDGALLRMTLEGPAALDRVDEVFLWILDEQGKDRLEQAPQASLSPEKSAQIIWGPYRFVPNESGTIDPDGRSARHGPIVRGGQNDSLLQFLERTPARSRNTTTKLWRDHYAEKPIRLSATCTRDGYKPWTQQFEFPVEPK